MNSFEENLAKVVYFADRELIIPAFESLEKNSENKRFVYTVLFKLRNGLDVTSILMANIESNYHFSDSICILLRALLADMITVNYLVFKSKFSDDIKEALHHLKSDHISRTLESLKFYKAIDRLSDEQLKLDEAKLKRQFSMYFDDQGNMNPELNSSQSIQKMIKSVASECPSSLFRDKMIKAYKYYDYYSKYEHLGHFTEWLVFKSYRNDSLPMIIGDIKECILMLVEFKYALLTEFYEKEKIESTEFWKYYTSLLNK